MISPATLGRVAPPTGPTRASSPAVAKGFDTLLQPRSQEPRSSMAARSDSLPAAALRGLASIERAQAHLDSILAAARTGKTFTAQELISLQGAAYRFSQTVELSAKLVEQGAQAVKQALNAQV